LLRLLHSTEGQPYSDLNVATDRDDVLDYYFNNGYPAAKFDFTSVPSVEPNHVDLTFTVTPGERVYVRDVVVDGLKRTRPDLVTDRISLHAGDPLSQSEINGQPAPSVRSGHLHARGRRYPKSGWRRAQTSTCCIRSKRPAVTR
jgi:outer membrane protein assembly factor BamA